MMFLHRRQSSLRVWLLVEGLDRLCPVTQRVVEYIPDGLLLVKNPKAELELPVVVGLRKGAERRGSKLHALSKWIQEVGMVEEVERLCPELAVHPFKDGEVASQGQVKFRIFWANDYVATCIAEFTWYRGCTRGLVITDKSLGKLEGIYIEPLRHCMGFSTSLRVNRCIRICDYIWAVCAAKGTAVVGR